jgi:hypothetical protein
MSRSRRSSKRRRNRRRGRGGALGRFTPHIIVGAGVLVIGLAVFFMARGGAPAGYEPEYTGGPRIAVDQEVYDYGYVKLNTIVTTDVEISNVGDEPLRIASIPQVQVLEGC